MKAAGSYRRFGRVVALTLAAVLATGVAGCEPGTPEKPAGRQGPAPQVASGFPVTIVDDADREVTIIKEPERIISLAPANTEMVDALGAFDRLVGVTTYDDYPAKVKDVPKMGDFVTPNMEAIAAANPDLVLVTGGVQADLLEKLESTGAKVFVLDPTSLDGVFDSITSLAKILGVPDRGDEVVAEMTGVLEGVQTKIGDEPPTTAFVEIGWNPLYTAGRDTLINDLLEKAGGTNVVAPVGYVGYSVEQLVKDQPQVYLGTRTSVGDISAMRSRAGYSALRCVVNGKVFTVDDNLISRPGPRVVQGIAVMASALHPSKFR